MRPPLRRTKRPVAKEVLDAAALEAHEEPGGERLFFGRAQQLGQVLVEVAVGPAEQQLADGLVGEAIPLAVPLLADLRGQHAVVVGRGSGKQRLDPATLRDALEL